MVNPATVEPTMTASAPTSRALVLWAACGATFVSLLDATITNLAVPALHDSFGSASVTTLSWVITLYAIGFAALLSPSGRVADVLGRRRLFIAGVATFTVMSAVAAVAPSLAVLFVARAVQGLAAAAMIPASLGIILVHSPVERRAHAIGLWSAAASAAAAVGPSVGGALVTGLSWRWLFVINIPVGLGMLWAARAIPRQEPIFGERPDVVGTGTLAAAIALAVLGLTQGSTWGWGDLRTWAAIGAAIVLAIATLARSASHRAPAIEIELWRIRPYAAANGASVLFGVLLYPWLLGGVLFLTQIWHYTELQAGLAVSPGAVASALVALGLGRASRPALARTAAIAGALLVAAVALWMVLVLDATPDFLTFWLPAGILSGAGMGAVSFGLSTAAALSVPPTKFASATGLNLTARQLGGGLGVAALAAMLTATPAPDVGGFQAVFAMCAAAGLIGSLLSVRLAAGAPAPQRSSGAIAAEGRA
jgi:EmrB/QacA subfamily drug resistance transporter